MPWYAILALAISSVITLGALIGIFYANYRNKYKTTTDGNTDQTIKTYKELIAAQDQKMAGQGDEIAELRRNHSESLKLIGQLQGELKSYKELPLKQISENMKGNAETLKTMLQLTALIAAHLKIDGLDKIDVTVK